VYEAQVGEEGVGHVLVEERGWADEVQCYSVWAALYLLANIFLHHSNLFLSMTAELKGEEELGNG
jgi:hypothetical protein